MKCARMGSQLRQKDGKSGQWIASSTRSRHRRFETSNSNLKASLGDAEEQGMAFPELAMSARIDDRTANTDKDDTESIGATSAIFGPDQRSNNPGRSTYWRHLHPVLNLSPTIQL